MEVHLTRKEIRRQVLGLINQTTDDLLTARVKTQTNTVIDAAAHWVAAFADWYCVERKSSIRIDAGDDTVSYYNIERNYWLAINYPNDFRPLTYGTPADTWVTNVTPVIKPIGSGGILDVVAWDDDANQWSILKPGRLPSTVEMERLRLRPSEEQKIATYEGDSPSEVAERMDAKTANLENVRGFPTHYEAEHDKIRVFPPVREDIVIRVKYKVFPTWLTHSQSMSDSQLDLVESVIDSMAIIYKTASMIYLHQGDVSNARYYDGMALERCKELRAAMNSDGAIRFDPNVTFEDEYVRQYPNYLMRSP
jgi:hypothetical protein